MRRFARPTEPVQPTDIAGDGTRTAVLDELRPARSATEVLALSQAPASPDKSEADPITNDRMPELRRALTLADAARRTGDVKKAEAVLAGFVSSGSDNAELAFSLAFNAEAAKDFSEARHRWREIRERFPWHPYPWAAEATMLCILKRYDDADDTLSLASAQAIETIEVLAAGVQIAIDRGDWLQAHERWRTLETRHPEAEYIKLARDRVTRIIRDGLISLDDAELRRLAGVAEANENWHAAVLLWDAARAQSPDRAELAVGYGRALRGVGALDESDTFFRSQLDRFRKDIVFRANHAEIAGVRQDWSEAADRWRRTLEDFPHISSVWSMAATAFRQAGDLDEAEALLAKAVANEPDRIDLRVIQAITAEKAQDWGAAVTRWNEALRLKPDDANLRNSRGHAQWEQQIALLEEQAASRTAENLRPEADPAAPDLATGPKDLRHLALSFESLGDHCEFGIVQRRLGADPIGLFRFAAISAGDLIGLLNTKFAELGDPEHTELGLTDAGEYLVRDRRGFYHMHTFIQEGSVEPAAFLGQQLRRLSFLKKKLIEDLQAAEKIFVHKSSHRRIDDATLLGLAAALQNYGPNTLLGLRSADAAHPPGSIEIIGQRVLVGYLATSYGAERMEVDLISWQKILGEARRLDQGGWPRVEAAGTDGATGGKQLQTVGMGMDWLRVCKDFRERLGTVRKGEIADPWRALCELARTRLDFVQTNALDRVASELFARHPGAFAEIRTVRLAVLGSSTVSHLHSGLRVGCMRRGIRLVTFETEFGAYRQELFDPSSTLAAFRPDYVLLALDGHHLARSADPAMTQAEADIALDAVGAELVETWRQARTVLNAVVLQQAALPLGLELAGNNEHRLAGSKATFLSRLNDWMRRHADQEGVHLVSVDRAAARHGLANWHSAALWNRSKHEVALPAMPYYGELVARLVAAIGGGSAKCLVLDLDNTLWGGVVGDDGMEGIVLGQGSAEGEAFVAVQRFALELSQRGIILAVCSKNDETIARRVFAEHPEMLLRQDRIASFVANWEDKATNIRRIATELNIGLDAMVFLDDNPVERDLIRRELPAVSVPELPADPAFYAQVLSDAGYFESVSLTDEDRERTGQYQANRQRRVQLDATTDMEGYLRDLQMTLGWKRFDAVALKRIVQLINKTNQFNLTTERMSEDAVRSVMDDEHRIGLQLRLQDRFGDNGIIAIVVASTRDEELHVDVWLMSCRVLGRRVEQATLDILVTVARAQNCRRLIGRFKPTSKNGIVAGHYASLGFTLTETQPDGATASVLYLDDYKRPDLPMTIEDMSQ